MFIPPVNPGFLLGGALGVGLAQNRAYSWGGTLVTALSLAWALGSAYREIDRNRAS